MHDAESTDASIAYWSWKLGNVYQILGKLDEALEMHEKSLRIRRATNGYEETHTDIANSIYDLACTYEDD